VRFLSTVSQVHFGYTIFMYVYI